MTASSGRNVSLLISCMIAATRIGAIMAPAPFTSINVLLAPSFSSAGTWSLTCAELSE